MKQPDIRPIGESGKLYLLAKDFTAHGITVPKGFRYDGASVPKIAWLVGLGRDGVHRAASLIHDWLYVNDGEIDEGSYTRKQADDLFRDMLKEYGVKSWHVFVAYRATRLFGWFWWSE